MSGELRDMLEETVERLFRERVTEERIEAAEQGAWDEDLWRALEDGGLVRPHLAEAAGGAGGSWLEAFVILRASGRHTVPLPVAETILAGWLLEQAGVPPPDGPVTVLPDPVPAPDLAGERLTTVAAGVPWGRHCPHAVLVSADGSGVHVGLVATDTAADVAHAENVGREPRDTLRFERAPLRALVPAGLPSDAIRLYGALVRSAQMAGAMESMLTQAVQYAGERVQFGRPIGKFQVIQQELAKLAGEVAAAGAASEAAFRAAARRDDARFEIAVAKARIGDGVHQATSIAHQVHGAIGFSYEHGLHFASRRLWAWRAEFGSDTHWAGELGREAIARGAAGLWPHLTGR